MELHTARRLRYLRHLQKTEPSLHSLQHTETPQRITFSTSKHVQHGELHTARHLRHLQHLQKTEPSLHSLQHTETPQRITFSTSNMSNMESCTRRVTSGTFNTSRKRSPPSTASSIQSCTQRVASGTPGTSNTSSIQSCTQRVASGTPRHLQHLLKTEPPLHRPQHTESAQRITSGTSGTSSNRAHPPRPPIYRAAHSAYSLEYI